MWRRRRDLTGSYFCVFGECLCCASSDYTPRFLKGDDEEVAVTIDANRPGHSVPGADITLSPPRPSRPGPLDLDPHAGREASSPE